MINESLFTAAASDMDKSCQAYSDELAGIRTGRASSKLLEDIEVEAYGSKMRLKELASIAVSDPRLLVVQPWDKSVMPAIEKAIRTSDLKLTPAVEGGAVRVPIPVLSEERRKELSKVLSKKAEDARVSVRNIRREVLDRIQDMRKKSEATEDEEKRSKDRVQKLTDAAVRKIDESLAKKSEELEKF
ncbi:ribosome recycling factor [bacterium]|nr:ribosome recycling factor [bacterium]